jgi:subtilisin family serine protease
MGKNVFATAVAGLLLAGTAAAAAPAGKAARYLVEYPAGNHATVTNFIARAGGTVVFDYAAINGLAADLTSAQLRSLRTAGLTTSIQADAYRTLHAAPDYATEFVPWGVDRVEADKAWSTSDSGADPNVRPGAVAGEDVIVAVLDSGIDYDHPDLEDNIIDRTGDGVIRDFVDGDDDASDSTNDGHGTIVASVIASVDNTVGVIGVAPHARIIPYRICNADACPLSAIIGGILRATADGVDVINMSFGGPGGFNLEAAAIQMASRAGIVLVASAGNEGNQKILFPAGYDTVVAVGATDENDARAEFSNFGGWVDVTAPGVGIPAATCQGCYPGAAILAETSPAPYTFSSAVPMLGTAITAVSARQVVSVGRACTVTQGDTLAADPAGKIALIVRGDCNFSEKVKAAEDAGAVGTIVYNNLPGGFAGKVLPDYRARGPAVSLSDAEGQRFLTDLGGSDPVVVDLEIIGEDYELADGTSFAAPHVAGVAALVKSANPGLSAIQVRKIIETTAEPLGPKLLFGNGMVRADKALEAALRH